MIPRTEYALLEGLGREVLAEGIAQGLGDLLGSPPYPDVQVELDETWLDETWLGLTWLGLT